MRQLQDAAACADAIDRCPGWATGGECVSNAGYMSGNCQLSCSICSLGPAECAAAAAAAGTAADIAQFLGHCPPA